jgi:hypothetical protein
MPITLDVGFVRLVHSPGACHKFPYNTCLMDQLCDAKPYPKGPIPALDNQSSASLYHLQSIPSLRSNHEHSNVR